MPKYSGWSRLTLWLPKYKQLEFAVSQIKKYDDEECVKIVFRKTKLAIYTRRDLEKERKEEVEKLKKIKKAGLECIQSIN